MLDSIIASPHRQGRLLQEKNSFEKQPFNRRSSFSE
jgi:hypothetical protein